jgi:hypothetical protein
LHALPVMLPCVRVQANTIHLGLLAGMGVNQLRGGSGIRVKKDKLTIATTVAAAAAAFHGYHGFKKSGII